MFIFVYPIDIENLVDGALYALVWPQEKQCLDEMLDKYSDSEYLEDYFRSRSVQLQYFNVNVEEAIVKTLHETNAIIQELNDLAEDDNLDDIFNPLHKPSHYSHPGFYIEYKAKGYEAPWIRLYAIRLDENLYCLTGFGIKLVKDMRDDQDLMNELKKLELATKYLKEKGLLE